MPAPVSPPLCRMLSLREVAGVLGVSLATVRRRVADGSLSIYRIGRAVRVSEADLAVFLASNRERI
ncbi:helix-turn-helix domain-containing protein [Acidiphilium sp.]|uniref:helix-turn-helix domain-containing protein n=1 Tax=Acidiphilium sp. TaxID=527 RepID=UPI003CFE1A6D